MFVKIQKSIGKSKLNNKGSSATLVSYLSKENEDKSPSEYEHFFNHDNERINQSSAQQLLDGQNKHLGKNDSKFFMLTINPSPKELQHLAKLSGSEKDINSIEELKPEQRKRFDILLKSYTKNVMELYADNFNRGIKGKDLVYVAKVEQNRTYKSFHDEVKQNKAITKEIHSLVVDRIRAEDSGDTKKVKKINKKIAELHGKYATVDGKPMAADKSNVIKAGDKKLGLHTHVHVVVHRNTKDFVKISPNANSKGHSQTNQKGKEIKVGFDHEQFKNASFKMFEKQFDYKSRENEKYEYSNLERASRTVTRNVSRSVSSTVGNKIKSKVKSEIYKNAFEGEFMKLKARSGQVQSLINNLANITRPEKLLWNAVKKVASKSVEKIR
ncbi:MAG: MobB family relaxase [Bacteroidota bacterium]